jgi:glutamyl-Q tRNA(Asp) synthetase
VRSNTATATTATDEPYVGRFAPTPSGDLHLGSLYAAAASYLDARAHGGRWLVRVEDLDKPREIAGSAAGILHTLQDFGFEWDGEITRQSDRIDRYAAALAELSVYDRTFACTCSRQQLEDEQRYPGTCRLKVAHAGVVSTSAIRLKVDPGFITFTDRIQGMFRQDVAAAVGDVIVQRRDQIFAYLLAVVVDDAAQGITHIVRGADLLDNTPRQIYLQEQLNFARPSYAHVPVLMEADGTKLAKSRRSVRLITHEPLEQLLSVFSLLGLRVPAAGEFCAIRDAWSWAIDQWHINYVPKCLKLTLIH